VRGLSPKLSETRAILLLISDNREHVRVRYIEYRPRTWDAKRSKPPRLLAADNFRAADVVAYPALRLVARSGFADFFAAGFFPSIGSSISF
jgi:hypothetical protein